MSDPSFLFHSAVFRMGVSRGVQLFGVEADSGGARRNPVRLRLVGAAGIDDGEGREADVLADLEMTHADAKALSEWLDGVITQTLAKPSSGLRRQWNQKNKSPGTLDAPTGGNRKSKETRRPGE